jgi:hypothetical protein
VSTEFGRELVSERFPGSKRAQWLHSDIAPSRLFDLDGRRQFSQKLDRPEEFDVIRSRGSELLNWTREWAQARSRLRGSRDAILGRADDQVRLDAAGHIEATSRFQPSDPSDPVAPYGRAPPGPGRDTTLRAPETRIRQARHGQFLCQPGLSRISARVMIALVSAQRSMDSNLMATKTVVPKPEPAGTTILQQLADLDARNLSPETARKLLGLGFTRSQQDRVDELSRKAQEGSLTPVERADLDEFIRVADLLAILQSRARQALRRTGLST